MDHSQFDLKCCVLFVERVALGREDWWNVKNKGGQNFFVNTKKQNINTEKKTGECSTEFINCRRIDKQACVFGLATWSNWFSQKCCGIAESKWSKAYGKAEVQKVSDDRLGKKKGQTQLTWSCWRYTRTQGCVSHLKLASERKAGRQDIIYCYTTV